VNKISCLDIVSVQWYQLYISYISQSVLSFYVISTDLPHSVHMTSGESQMCAVWLVCNSEFLSATVRFISAIIYLGSLYFRVECMFLHLLILGG